MQGNMAPPHQLIEQSDDRSKPIRRYRRSWHGDALHCDRHCRASPSFPMNDRPTLHIGLRARDAMAVARIAEAA
jgi:hypothetical protein